MTNSLAQRLWNHCNPAIAGRDDGLSSGVYVEPLTCLLFLEMADGQSHPPFNKPSPIPKGKAWSALHGLRCAATQMRRHMKFSRPLRSRRQDA